MIFAKLFKWFLSLFAKDVDSSVVFPNDMRKQIKLELMKRDMSMADIAKELGLTRQAVYMALKRGTKTGKVAEWIQKTLKIDLKKTA